MFVYKIKMKIKIQVPISIKVDVDQYPALDFQVIHVFRKSYLASWLHGLIEACNTNTPVSVWAAVLVVELLNNKMWDLLYHSY